VTLREQAILAVLPGTIRTRAGERGRALGRGILTQASIPSVAEVYDAAIDDAFKIADLIVQRLRPKRTRKGS
jgi:hypothetical protein